MKSVIALGLSLSAPLVLMLSGSGAQAEQGELTVTPNSGPVGTTVVLEGQGCNNPGWPAHVAFGGAPEDEQVTGTPGADGIPNIPVDAQDSFSITYTIPAEIGGLQGRGGGLVVPGVYKFFSKPPYCSVTFTVTAAGLPGTGSAPPDAAPESRAIPVWALALGSGLAAAGLGLAAAHRRLGRRA